MVPHHRSRGLQLLITERPLTSHTLASGQMKQQRGLLRSYRVAIHVFRHNSAIPPDLFNTQSVSIYDVILAQIRADG